MRTAEHKLNAVQRLRAYREAVTHPAGGSIVVPVLWLPGPAALAVWVAAGALRENTLTRPGSFRRLWTHRGDSSVPVCGEQGCAHCVIGRLGSSAA